MWLPSNRPMRLVGLAALGLLALAAPAAADLTPPGWAHVRHRNLLDPGRFASRAGPEVPGGAYRFFVTAVRLWPVPPGGRFPSRTSRPSKLIAVPVAHVDRWLDLVAAHEDPRAPAIYETARATIPGFATARIPPQRALRARSSPLEILETTFHIEAIERGAIRYAVTERRLDRDGRPIGRAMLALVGVATVGLTGLIVTAMRRRRKAGGS